MGVCKFGLGPLGATLASMKRELVLGVKFKNPLEGKDERTPAQKEEDRVALRMHEQRADADLRLQTYSKFQMLLARLADGGERA
jgi:hypothetical protein